MVILKTKLIQTSIRYSYFIASFGCWVGYQKPVSKLFWIRYWWCGMCA